MDLKFLHQQDQRENNPTTKAKERERERGRERERKRERERSKKKHRNKTIKRAQIEEANRKSYNLCYETMSKNQTNRIEEMKDRIKEDKKKKKKGKELE